jgi:hypothetical protein
MEDDTILPNPNWSLLTEKLKDHATFNTTFFSSVNPVFQNIFLLAIRQMSMNDLVGIFNQISPVFSVEEISDFRAIIGECNFPINLFGGNSE